MLIREFITGKTPGALVPFAFPRTLMSVQSMTRRKRSWLLILTTRDIIFRIPFSILWVQLCYPNEISTHTQRQSGRPYKEQHRARTWTSKHLMGPESPDPMWLRHSQRLPTANRLIIFTPDPLAVEENVTIVAVDNRRHCLSSMSTLHLFLPQTPPMKLMRLISLTHSLMNRKGSDRPTCYLRHYACAT